MLVALMLAALAVVALVSDPIVDPDIGQHLTVGRAIWTSHAVPTTQLWSWPTYGEPVVTPSWLFRALLWPFWNLAGVGGLYAWRWITTLAAAVLMWVTARRLGASGVVAVLTVMLAIVGYRQRSQLRPETLAVVLLALQTWLLAGWRADGRDRTVPLVATALVWANAHVSYWLGLLLAGAFLVDAWLPVSRAASAGRSRIPVGRLALAAGLMAVAALVNPFGWRAAWQPFEYALFWSHEPIFGIIGELRPFDWSFQWHSLSPLVLIGWPALVLARGAWLGRWDRAELLLCLALVPLPLGGQRFIGFVAIAAGPFLARDASELAARARGRASATAAVRLLLLATGLASLLACVYAVRLWRPGPRLNAAFWPAAACDFIAREGVRGRGLTQFDQAGYLLWRFWPDRSRLPFMDIHQSGSRELRDLYAYAQGDRASWRRLEARYHFDYAVLGRRVPEADSLLAFLDDDSAWTLVFLDDAAAVYVRPTGALASVAARYAYHVLPGSRARFAALGAAALRDPGGNAALAAEAARSANSSPANARALGVMAVLALSADHLEEGERLLRMVLRVDPDFVRVHELLGQLARERGEFPAAIREFALERRLQGPERGVWFEEGRTWMRAGRRDRAAKAFRAELKHFPGNAAARESLAVAERGR